MLSYPREILLPFRQHQVLWWKCECVRNWHPKREMPVVYMSRLAKWRVDYFNVFGIGYWFIQTEKRRQILIQYFLGRHSGSKIPIIFSWILVLVVFRILPPIRWSQGFFNHKSPPQGPVQVSERKRYDGRLVFLWPLPWHFEVSSKMKWKHELVFLLSFERLIALH